MMKFAAGVTVGLLAATMAAGYMELPFSHPKNESVTLKSIANCIRNGGAISMHNGGNTLIVSCSSGLMGTFGN